MTAFRLHIGPVQTPMGVLHEVLHIREDGQIVRAAGDTLAAAQALLEAEPDTQEPWRGSEALGGTVGLPAGSVQIAAALRHIFALLDPGLELDCPEDDALHSLIAAMAAMVPRGPGLRPGTSRPYRFECEGVHDGRGHAILSASADGVTCLAMRDEEDVRRVYEAGLGRAPQDLGINMIGAMTGSQPEWAREPMRALTGQSFAPELLVRLHGQPAPFGPKSALMLALLLGAWPMDPDAGQPEQSEIALPAGRGRVTLFPISP